MTVSSREQAWAEAGKIFPTDYDEDTAASAKAGYPIYRFHGWDRGNERANNWISDLGNRLEVNLEDGQTVNIWIKAEPAFTEWALEDALEVVNEALYEICDKVGTELQATTGIDKARASLYGAFAAIAEILKKDYPDSPLFDRYNLKEA